MQLGQNGYLIASRDPLVSHKQQNGRAMSMRGQVL